MGPCIAGGAYLPALSDVIIMVEDTSFMGLGGPNLVKGAIGQSVDSESLGGASLHTRISGVAHYATARRRRVPRPDPPAVPFDSAAPARPEEITPPLSPAEGLYDVLPADHRAAYDMEDVLDAHLRRQATSSNFSRTTRPRCCAPMQALRGRPSRVIANRRGFLRTPGGPRIGGIVYAESARKVAYFVENAERQRTPLIYLQDVSGFMVGAEAESDGIIRAGAEMVESMACATVPKIVLTLNHASGAGYYAMAGQGFDPHFTFGWPTARIGVMEGDSAIRAVHGPELDKLASEGKPIPPELQERIDNTKADYDRWLDAPARGRSRALRTASSTRSPRAGC